MRVTPQILVISLPLKGIFIVIYIDLSNVLAEQKLKRSKILIILIKTKEKSNNMFLLIK